MNGSIAAVLCTLDFSCSFPFPLPFIIIIAQFNRLSCFRKEQANSSAVSWSMITMETIVYGNVIPYTIRSIRRLREPRSFSLHSSRSCCISLISAITMSCSPLVSCVWLRQHLQQGLKNLRLIDSESFLLLSWPSVLVWRCRPLCIRGRGSARMQSGRKKPVLYDGMFCRVCSHVMHCI